MYLTRIYFGLFLIFFLSAECKGFFFRSSDSAIGLNAVRKAPRWNMPWLGVGVRCNGCPPHGCEDDEAIIHGFCCGCAYGLDRVPVLCPDFLQCPLNLHGLCHDYEYMMNCCC
ncbi:uncharacterized protein LOC120632381 [Pararge aegeria]|uniref:uncharacterized protein LOC120632381 n=1 Tax=Pararge aegeria TaxID=116150 RepID=UPI0019CFD473|nr:uncharacterized protein LOC120632381 [Pararge aegeria]